jgi:integrase
MEIAANKAIQEQLVESGFVECKKCGVWMYEGELKTHRCKLEYVYKKDTQQRPSTRGMLVKAKPIFEKDEINKLKEYVAVAFTGNTGIRNRSYIILGMNTGLRGSDLVALRMEDLELPFEGPEAFTAGMMITIRESKTRKPRPVYLNQTAIDALVEWLDIRGYGPGYIFCSARGTPEIIAKNAEKPLTLEYYRIMLRKLGRKIGIELKQRTLRKTWATHTWKSGVPIETISKCLGHYNVRDTYRYLCIRDQEIVDAYNVEI